MPLSLRMTIDEISLGLWNLKEPEDELLDRLQLIPSEIADLNRLRGRRRLEWLGARSCLQAIESDPGRHVILKDQHGKPHYQVSDKHISFSHSYPLIAASQSDLRHGIDVQRHVDKISRIREKFCSVRELEYNDSSPESLHIIWGIKEAMYKAWGKREIDFIRHLYVEPFRYVSQGGKATAYLKKDDNNWQFSIRYFALPDTYAVLASTRDGSDELG